jgi:hypothetical protein
MDAKLTEEMLQTIEDCGAAEMPLDETLEIAEMTRAEWDSSSEAVRRYRKGQLMTKMSIRNAVIKGAKGGNPALLKAYQEFAGAQDLQMLRRLDGDSEASEEFKDI